MLWRGAEIFMPPNYLHPMERPIGHPRRSPVCGRMTWATYQPKGPKSLKQAIVESDGAGRMALRAHRGLEGSTVSTNAHD